MSDSDHGRHAELRRLEGAFGADAFGRRAEAFARFFGTPTFLVGQTVVVAVWITLNVTAATLRWDPYPFILLNLAFSLQAAYAAPLILLAQTRQAYRDRVRTDADERHREEVARAIEAREEAMAQLLEMNTRLTEQIQTLAEEIRARLDERR